jgi:6-pyruvoyltetrahydropterin/6-carboxytetrahydropterin synthase
MFELGVLEEFEAIHSLKGDFGPATCLHGHTYKVQVVVQGDRLDKSGALYDVSKVRENLKGVLGHLHFQNLDELEEFQGVNSTLENVCKYIYEKLAPSLREAPIQHLKVTLWESPSAFASYWEGF